MLSSIQFISTVLSIGLASAISVPAQHVRRVPAGQLDFNSDSLVSFPSQDGVSIEAGQLDRATFNASFSYGGQTLDAGPRDVPADWKLDLAGVDFDFTKDWAALYYRDFHTNLTLEIDCTPDATGLCDYSGLVSNSTVTTDALVVSVLVDFLARVNASRPVKFTQPFSVAVQHAAVLISFANLDAPSAVLVGFERAQVNLGAFATEMQLGDVKADIRLRPGLDLLWTQSPASNIQVVAAPTLPRITLDITALNGTAACEPAGPGPVLRNLTRVERSVGAKAAEFTVTLTKSLSTEETNVTQTQSSDEIGDIQLVEFETAGCFQLDPVAKKLVPPAAVPGGEDDAPGEDKDDGAGHLEIGILAVMTAIAAAMLL